MTLAPVSNVFVLIGSIMGERFLYLPSVGFAAAVVFGARAIWRREPAIAPPSMQPLRRCRRIRGPRAQPQRRLARRAALLAAPRPCYARQL